MGTSYEQRYDWQYLHNPAGKGSILFAYEGEKPVGQIASFSCRYVSRDGTILTAIAGEWLCVSPQYRGKGIMSKLIEFRLNDRQSPFVLDMPNKVPLIRGFTRVCYLPMNMKSFTKREQSFLIVFIRGSPKKSSSHSIDFGKIETG